MISLKDADPCAASDGFCTSVFELTGNAPLASAADWLIAKPLAVLVAILAGLVARYLVNKLIDRVVRHTRGVYPAVSRRRPERFALPLPAMGLAAQRREQRAETMGSMLKSIAAFMIFSLVAIMVIAELGYNIGPLIASAGLVGVALGFGAQSLVKDFLSGIFMFFENQFGVGDRVIIGDTAGEVEALSLRVTRVRGDDGTVWYVRNGEILRVGNVSQRLPGDPTGTEQEVPQ